MSKNVASVLQVHSSGCVDVQKDLQLTEGKSIAELLYGEKTKKEDNKTDQQHS